MEFTIKNVGLIKNSTIKLDGLTVITGANNSGKTTIGKALYASIEGLGNISKKLERDIYQTYVFRTRKAFDILGLNLIRKYIDINKVDEDIKEILGRTKYYYRTNTIKEINNKVKKAIVTIEQLNVEKILGCLIVNNINKNDLEAYFSNFDENKNTAIKVLKDLLDFLNNESEENYAQKSVLNLLNKEFKNQIYPVNGNEEDKISSVSLVKNGELGFKFSLKDNKDMLAFDFVNAFYNNAIFIDNPFILDGMENDDFFFYNSRYTGNYIQDHQKKLINILTDENEESIVEQIISNNNILDVIKKINKIIPGTIKQKEGIYYYYEANKKPIKVDNLAAGSKWFSIIKNILEKGFLDFDTILILDEPESHLHPEWQNIMAEVVVLLVKELKVNVLLTTHSPNFVLAIETNMMKYKIQEKTNFYFTRRTNDNMREYQDVTSNLDIIYSDFVKFFSEMKSERAKYIEKENGN